MEALNTLSSVDLSVAAWFYSIRMDWLTPIVIGITYLGNWQVLVVGCVCALAICGSRRPQGCLLSATALMAWLLDHGCKLLVRRERPDVLMHLIEQGGYSFPSGHAATAAAFYGILLFLILENVRLGGWFGGGRRRLSYLLAAMLVGVIVLVGVSRMYLGVHYLTDVVCGWLLGGLCAIGAILLSREWQKKRIERI